MSNHDSNSIKEALSEVVSFEDIVTLWKGFATDNEEEMGLKNDAHYDQSTRKSTLLPQRKAQPRSCSDIMQLVTQLDKLSTTLDAKENGHLKEMDELASQLLSRIIKKYKKEICFNEKFIKRYSFYFLISLKLLQNVNDKNKRGLLNVSIISAFNEMIVLDKSFQSFDNEEKKEVFLLLIELAREAEEDLDTRFKFDDGAILLGFDTIVAGCLDEVNPAESFADDLKKSKNYFIPEFLKSSDFHLLIEFLHQKLLQIPIKLRFEYCKKYMYELDENKNLDAGYDALRYFIDHDHEMQNQVNSELQLLKNPHNIEAIRRILSETSSM
jgi:hypothetical protein